MFSRQKERFGGLFIATIGASLAIWNWYIALNESRFYLKAAFAGPAFTIIGLALLIFPGYQTERIERGEDISKLSGAALMTPRWWGILAIALVAGIANSGMMYSLKI